MSEYSIPDGLKYVPINFMDVEGNISDRPPGRPVVQVVLRYDPEHSKGARAPLSYAQSMHCLIRAQIITTRRLM